MLMGMAFAQNCAITILGKWEKESVGGCIGDLNPHLPHEEFSTSKMDKSRNNTLCPLFTNRERQIPEETAKIAGSGRSCGGGGAGGGRGALFHKQPPRAMWLLNHGIYYLDKNKCERVKKANEIRTWRSRNKQLMVSEQLRF